MYRFYIDKEEELTTDKVGKIIRKFEEKVLPSLKFVKGYYDGVGQRIMKRATGDPSRPNNRIVKNYCATIVDNFQGYLTGNPVTYSSGDDRDISGIQLVLEDNDVPNEDSEFLRTALIYGISFELVYVNENNEIRFKNVNPEGVIPVYSDDLDQDLEYVISFSPIQDWNTDEALPPRYRVCVYDSSNVYTYEATNAFNDFTLLDDTPHYFQGVPWCVFNLNVDNASIFERIISLQDAYNSLLSDEVNDFQAFVDAYMVLKNITATTEDLANMKQNRTILIDGDSDVDYLTKDISDTQIQNMLDNINTSIHTISNSPDFSSEEFNQGVSSGTALQFKLVGFNNLASNIQAQMKKALTKRITLINTILHLVDTETFKVDIDFTHNLPNSISDVVQMVNSLRGLVSDETLLSQIPFIDDVQNEMRLIQKQNEQNVIEPIPAGVGELTRQVGDNNGEDE